VTKYTQNLAGELATTAQQQVGNFGDFFSPIYNASTPPRWGALHRAKFVPRQPDRTVREPQRWGVAKALRQLRHTSSGRSGTPLDVWVTLALHTEALDIITHLMQGVWRQELVPAAWTRALSPTYSRSTKSWTPNSPKITD
jgi:hypothetical protein